MGTRMQEYAALYFYSGRRMSGKTLDNRVHALSAETGPSFVSDVRCHDARKDVSENTLADRIRATRTAIGTPEPTDERADIILRPNH